MATAKTAPSNVPQYIPLHQKYRPATLDEVVGHDAAVTTLRGFAKTGKLPSAIGFFGPTSAGKTTLAMALANSVLGPNGTKCADFTIINAGDNRTIEDVRRLNDLSRISPSGGKRRIIVVDEAQGILSNSHAATAWLAALERPAPKTTWVLTSMSPDAFAATTNGRAIANRCRQFHLKAPGDDDMQAQLRRITSGEELTFFTKSLREAVVTAADHQMRQLANIVEGLVGYYNGMDEEKRPAKLSAADVDAVLSSQQTPDDMVAVRLLTAIYAGKSAAAVRETLDVSEPFPFIGKLLTYNHFVLANTVLAGARHPKVWASTPARQLASAVSTLAERTGFDVLTVSSAVHAALVRLKTAASTFAVPETHLLAEFAVRTSADVRALKS